jgi:hypothetical protein
MPRFVADAPPLQVTPSTVHRLAERYPDLTPLARWFPTSKLEGLAALMPEQRPVALALAAYAACVVLVSRRRMSRPGAAR